MSSLSRLALFMMVAESVAITPASLFLTPAPATHWGCRALCSAGNGSLACIGSAADNANASAFTANFFRNFGTGVWIGVHQGVGAAEPAGDWGACSNGKPAWLSVDAWEAGEPNHWGFGEDCASLEPSGQWNDRPCGLALHCVCEIGTVDSPNFTAFADAQRELWPQVEQTMLLWTLLVYLGIIPLLSLLPMLCSWAYARARRGCRRTESRGPATPCSSSPTAAATAATAATAPAAACTDTESGFEPASSGKTAFERSAKLSVEEEATIAKGERAAKALRNRVSGTISHIGWLLVVLGITPFLLFILGIDLTPTAGSWAYYLGTFCWGLAMFVLALRPIDAMRITRTSRFLFCFCNLLAPLFVFCIFFDLFGSDPVRRVGFGLLALVFFTSGALLAPSALLPKRSPPRRQLQRLLLVLRLQLLAFGGVLLSFVLLGPAARDGRLATVLVDPINCGLLVSACLTLLAAVAFTPTTRGFVHRWLGSLGKSSSKQQEAAAVASIIGGHKGGAVAAFTAAKRTFRALAVSKLTQAELTDKSPDPELAAKASAASLGEVAAFV